MNIVFSLFWLKDLIKYFFKFLAVSYRNLALASLGKRIAFLM